MPIRCCGWCRALAWGVAAVWLLKKQRSQGVESQVTEASDGNLSGDALGYGEVKAPAERESDERWLRIPAAIR